jgi:hypothetical protein
MLLEKEMGVPGVGGDEVVMRGGGWWGVVGCGSCIVKREVALRVYKHGWGRGLAA